MDRRRREKAIYSPFFSRIHLVRVGNWQSLNPKRAIEIGSRPAPSEFESATSNGRFGEESREEGEIENPNLEELLRKGI